MITAGVATNLAPDILAVARDTDYRSMAAEYLAVLEALVGPEVVAVNVNHYRLDELAEAGRWGAVAYKLFNLVEAAEEHYA